MKSFITAIIIAAVLISGSFAYTKVLSDKSESLSVKNAEIIALLESENYDTAKEKLNDLGKDIDDFEEFFLATGDHFEMDNLRTNLSELRSFVENEMQGDALSKAYVLDFLLNHLPETTRIRIGNIL